MSVDKKGLNKKIIISGTMVAVTGLHIGGTNNELSIGGMDNAVIRNPVTQKPYVPGSSLKGKMRSLTELAHGTFGPRSMGRDINSTPTNNPRHLAARLFGYTQFDEERNKKPAEREFNMQQPSRLIVRDCHLSNEDELRGILVEEKAETVIDRITSAAMPRQMERVPAGAEFGFQMVLNVFDGEDEQEYLNGIFNALRLIQDDYLGGAGSRGSGQVSFKIESIQVRSKDYYKGDGEVTNADLSHYELKEL